MSIQPSALKQRRSLSAEKKAYINLSISFGGKRDEVSEYQIRELFPNCAYRCSNIQMLINSLIVTKKNVTK
jgi:hypothetical protein